MKHMKKFLVAFVALVAALAIATPAYAGSITIKPQSGATGTNTATYNYYELLHASVVTDDEGNVSRVSYFLNDGTDDALRTLLDAVKIGNDDLFTFTQSADGKTWVASVTGDKEFSGADIAAAVNTDEIKAAALDTGEFKQVADNGKADDLEDGYYLVTSSLGTKLVIQTLNDVEIETKNDGYNSGKTASKTNMEVGDIVTYTVTVDVPASAVVGDEVTVHDTLDAHLAIDMDSIAAKLGDAEVALTDGVKKADTETFAKKFTVNSDMIGKTVTITYDAELLSTAADDTGYVNDMWANTPSYETVPTKVNVYTFDFDLDKEFTGAEGDAEDFVATFELQDNDGNVIDLVKNSDTQYTIADSDDTDTVKVITINNDQVVNVKGVAEGTYKLVELSTADGYNLLTDPVEVTITDTSDDTGISHSVSYKIGDAEAATGTVTVENNAGTELPSTGGMGTTLFYIVGGLMVAGAAIALIAKNRVAKMEA